MRLVVRRQDDALQSSAVSVVGRELEDDDEDEAFEVRVGLDGFDNRGGVDSAGCRKPDA